jgi:hypothetical protein
MVESFTRTSKISESISEETTLSSIHSELISFNTNLQQELQISENKETLNTPQVIKLTYAQAHKKLSQPLSPEELAGNIIYQITDRKEPKYELPKKFENKDNIIIHGSC